jgi:hypothetical protein
MTPPTSLAFSLTGGPEAAAEARREMLAGDRVVPIGVREPPASREAER